jgi:hypothetical protein
VLRGGFGTPEGGFVLRWRHSAAAKEALGYAETVRCLERARTNNPNHYARELADARHGTGPTVFDWLVEIIAVHGPGGDEAGDNVHLILD